MPAALVSCPGTPHDMSGLTLTCTNEITYFARTLGCSCMFPAERPWWLIPVMDRTHAHKTACRQSFSYCHK